jgi:hypothetical protein
MRQTLGSHTVHWSFRKKKDDCQDAAVKLDQERMNVECYSDPILLAQYSSLPVVSGKQKVKAYEEGVGMCIVAKATDKHPGESYSSTIDYGVDFADCSYFTKKDDGTFVHMDFDRFASHARNELFQCDDDALIEAVLAHEKMHEQQCRDTASRRAGEQQPVRYQSSTELESYCHEAKLIDAYMKESCPSTSPAIEAIKKACADRFK